MKRGALIGCGFFARNHMNAWGDVEGAEIVAVCDIDPGKAATMAERFAVARSYADAAEMLAREKLDFVDVATTAPSHRMLVEMACRQVSAVICQKPFAENLTDAHAMVAAAQSAGVHLIIHENFRWQKSFITMKSLIEQGRIGVPHFARFSFRHGYDNYVNQPYLAEIERFVIMDVGLHLFDLARHFMGDVARIACTTQRLNPVIKGEDMFTALLTHDSGTTSSVDCSFFSKIDPEPFPQVAAWIEGSEGTLELRTDFRLVLHHTGMHEVLDIEPAVPGWGERPWHNVQDSVVRFQSHVVDVLEGRAEPRPSGRHNLATLALALAAYDAAETGRCVDMATWKGGSA